MKRLRMVVEWSRGSPVRFAWKDGRLLEVGRDRPAPVNYGLLPGLLNPADGEEVDAVFLGPPLPPGTEAEGLVVGLLWLADGDHKLLLAPSLEALAGEDLTPLLSWFPRERAPRVEGPESAQAWLEALQKAQDR